MTADPNPTTTPSAIELSATGLTLGYHARSVVRDVSVTVPPGRITAIVGANGSGKSTLLRGLARLMTPRRGAVLLDGRDIAGMAAKTLAQRLGLLPQQPLAPDGITVSDLVGRGRHPHQRWFRHHSDADGAAIASAMEATGIAHLADEPVDELSGGQRQRVWLALALAQDPDVMLLDEPTTHLDLAHQIDLLELLADLNARLGRTTVLVLHDLNLAGRYAHHLVAVTDGRIAAEGAPAEVLQPDTVASVFGLTCEVIDDPLTGTPIVLPRPPADSRRST
ncbi:iron complex transport system ATP-binding protein [Prauserella isguenensis]|uniref:Iron complex transport system ATP-binding protein n=1 Tax=Prauserella isguenensis TaxID=1470180 RepID=A0A839S5W9_9PSEU|nr:ABC transporter ATP-binding protein [Prauserella isguenensis]MBB3052400.1 iron complex transport system ATP-binding protein [Prauserella isguenensis]